MIVSMIYQQHISGDRPIEIQGKLAEENENIATNGMRAGNDNTKEQQRSTDEKANSTN